MAKIKKALYRMLLVGSFDTHFVKAIEAGITRLSSTRQGHG